MAQTTNMTEGKPFPIIFAYFIPVLFSSLCQQLYSIVDTIIVGKGIGDMALAAVGSSGAITFFIFGFMMGLSSGMAVMLSQAYGAGDYKLLRKSIAMGVLSCGIVAFVVMVFSMIYVKPVMVALKTSEVILGDALLYIRIIIIGIPLTLAYNCLAGILNALGDSRTPFVAVIISTIINVFLDCLFIMGFGMGVEGAAIATLIAQVCSGIFCFSKLYKVPIVHIKKEDCKLDISLIFKQFRIGVPVAFMNSITAIGCLLLQYYVNTLGVNYTAAYSASSKISQFLTQPSTAVGMTMATYAGQNFGAGKIDRIRQGIKEAGKITLTITIIATVALIFIPRVLAGFVLSEPEIIDISILNLQIRGAMMWSLAFLFLVRSTLQGMGSTFVPMISGILELVVRVVFVVLLIDALGFPAIAVAETLAWFSAFALNGLFLLFKLIRMKNTKKEVTV